MELIEPPHISSFLLGLLDSVVADESLLRLEFNLENFTFFTLGLRSPLVNNLLFTKPN